MVSVQPSSLVLTEDEVIVLASLMRDVQVSVSAFYAKTATSADVNSLGTEVRAFLSSAQTLNERLTGSISDNAAYRSALSGTDFGELIDAVKYVRNVTQHVMHVVRPSSETTLIGGLHGLRLYAVWDDVPSSAHAALRRGTQALRPAFESRLLGREVTETMLSLLQAFASIAPQIVHRDPRGEWTGFPLRSQPGVRGRVHPEEPHDVQDAFVWLNTRLPAGDLRLVVGQVTIDGEPNLLGYTVDDRTLTSVFAEPCQQVVKDVEAGYEYLRSDASELSAHLALQRTNTDLPSERVAPIVTGDVRDWAAPMAAADSEQDWGIDLSNPEWARVVRFAERAYVPEEQRYEIRRAQRMNVA